jgi:hypothetical protein
MNAADIADGVFTGVQRAGVICKSLVAAGLAREDGNVIPPLYSPIEVSTLSARRQALKYARELWKGTRPPGNSQAREEIMRFKSGRYGM